MLSFVAAAAALGLSMPAAGQPQGQPQQVRFTGRTSVDSVVIRDVLRQLTMIAAAREGCATLTAVEAEPMPVGWQPPESNRVTGARYERWDATLCGRSVPFLLGFWHPPEGGTMFQLSSPFPGEGTPQT